MKILFKKDSKNKIRIWKIWTEGAELKQSAGLKDGKLVEHVKTCKGKNIGKSNETTPSEQAKLELESTYLDKLSEGYFKNEADVLVEEVILPMLAKSYDDYKDKIDWGNAFIQPKLDGMRCLAILKDGFVTLKSRDGKVIQNMSHIVTSLEDLNLVDCVLDGELYCHGLSFQDNMKLIKKYRSGETEKIKYHVYDLISKDSFSNRYAFLKSTYNVEKVVTSKIKSDKDLRIYHSKNITNGYEGSIIRWSNDGYKVNGRSDKLLKYKDFKDIDLKIIDIESAEQRPEQGVPVFELNNKQFRSGVKMSHKDREDLLVNKKDYIGRIANVRYFELTDDGIPRFPVMVGIHGDR